MRINIGRKLWLAFFCTLTLCVLTMYLLMHNSLKRGFLDYTSQQAVQRLEILQDALVSIHREEGSFTQLTADPSRWLSLKSIIFSSESSRVTVQGDYDEPNGRSSAQYFYREFVSSVSLYDADKTLLMGVVKPNQQISWVPINNGESLLGYVGFVKPTVVIRESDRRFVSHQLWLFGIISLVILAISVAIATLLARRISKPITALLEHTTALASGDYQRRVAVNSRDEIGQLCQGFNQLAQALEANEQSRANWIADISHEMRTPVSVLKAQIEAMQDGVRPVDAKTLDLLHDKISDLSGLIDNLFELTLSDIGALDYQKESLSLSVLTRACAEHYQDKAATAGLTLKVMVPEKNPLSVHGDPQRLQQLLYNLLENAIRYTNSGGRIEVELTQSQHRVVLLVRDSAPAVAAEQHNKIFERLYRVEASRNRSTGGAGLGLAICKNIVAAHQGEIMAETSRLGGLAIRVTLPQTL
ncbi:MAG TPA: ATP-binding protein [Cellvibrionaceae bacterium]